MKIKPTSKYFFSNLYNRKDIIRSTSYKFRSIRATFRGAVNRGKSRSVEHFQGDVQCQPKHVGRLSYVYKQLTFHGCAVGVSNITYIMWINLQQGKWTFINLLNPTGHVMHQQFNIQQLYALPTLYLCVLYLSENRQRLVPLTAQTDWFL